MKRAIAACVLFLATIAAGRAVAAEAEGGFVNLFDGKTLDGWKVGKNADCFQVRDGMIVVNGLVAHLFYDGPVANHDFKNFHFKAEVMTYPNSNSGIYFHTRFQEEGFPKFGVECQVNNSHKDWRRTGSLYGVMNVTEAAPAKPTNEGVKILPAAPAKDEVWYTQEIIVQGLQVTVKIDGQTILEYTLPPDAVGECPFGRMTWLPRGTFALQGHDPGSKVCYRNIRVKVLPD